MKRFKKFINDIDLNYRNEILIFVLINFVFIALSIFMYIFIKNILYVGISIALLFIFNALNVYRLYELKNNKYYKDLSNLLYLFNSLSLNLHNDKNIVNALKNIKDITNLKLNTYVNNLIESIDEDKSINPYLAFAHNYSSIKVEEIMVSIYFFNLNELDSKINDLHNELNEYSSKHNDKLFESINLIPIIGVMLLISVAIICILNNIQGK